MHRPTTTTTPLGTFAPPSPTSNTTTTVQNPKSQMFQTILFLSCFNYCIFFKKNKTICGELTSKIAL